MKIEPKNTPSYLSQILNRNLEFKLDSISLFETIRHAK